VSRTSSSYKKGRIHTHTLQWRTVEDGPSPDPACGKGQANAQANAHAASNRIIIKSHSALRHLMSDVALVAISNYNRIQIIHATTVH
jgi:hypothetical protein